MPNVFVLYIPPNNAAAIRHYEDTILEKVDQATIARLETPEMLDQLRQVFGDRRIAVWGSRSGLQNTGKFDAMRPGDHIVIVEGPHVRLLGIIAGKTRNPALARDIWRHGGEEPFELVYFIANPREINLPWARFCELFGYSPDFTLRGFTRISEERVADFYRRYDDLYDVLIQLRDQGRAEELPPPEQRAQPTSPLPEPAVPGPEASDHVRYQWMLSRLGRKAGRGIWVPAGDRGRITTAFQFNDFEPTLAAGLDMQTRYIENIDVVWKEEFRIDAAFEVECTTAIYSGLLRFADLSAVAPNSSYPLFIVAPRARREQVVGQLRRPAFRRLQMHQKVRYLPGEAVEEIDGFFEASTTGPDIEVFLGRSEQTT